MTTLPLTKTTVTYSGSSVSYTVADATVIAFKLWGGGGSGVYIPTTGIFTPGGGAGFTTGSFVVVPGDVIKIEVGQGGRLGSWDGGAFGSGTSTGGLGGWPDGGPGGATFALGGGGGGGSTRVYINNVLIAVAGAGGGCGYAATDRRAGNGGGPVGSDSLNTTDPSTRHAGGGTQSAGGVNTGAPTDASYKGASLQGGNGFSTGGNNTSERHDSGGGGGGGYFGGAGGGLFVTGVGDFVTAGGGGSGYINTGHGAYLGGATTAGALGLAAGSSDTDYPSLTGNGGLSSVTIGAATAGQNGAVVFQIDSAKLLALDTKTAVDYSGAAVKYVADRNGTLDVKMWGAGGGSSSTSANTFGGGGGYTTINLGLVAGDVVSFYPGREGWSPQLNTGLGGQPGDPDGGYGGLSSSNVASSGGAGGSSTRVKINGTLVAVAGGGGGGHRANGPASGGAGGGATGQDGSGTNTTVTGKGGTQSAGGAGASGASFRAGTQLVGGPGTDTTISSITSTPGGGGGGGYWGGGGGGGNSSSLNGPGGGGSGYLNTSYATYNSGTTTTGNGVTAGNSTDLDLLAGRARGGDLGGATNTLKNGGSGYIVYTFSSGVPAFATGDIATVAVSVPVGKGQVPASTHGDLATVTMSAPAAHASVPVVLSLALPQFTVSAPLADAGGDGAASGDLATIEVDGNIGGQGTVSATVIIPFADSSIFLTSPDGVGIGSDVDIDGLPSPIVFHISAPKPSIEAAAHGDLATVTLTAPEGGAEEAPDHTGDIGTISLTAPEGSAVGSALAKPKANEDGSLLYVRVHEPLASVHTPDQGIVVPLPDGWIVTPPLGEGGPAVFASGDLGDPVILTSPDGAGTVSVNVRKDIAQVTLSAPTGAATAGAVIALTFTLLVQITSIPHPITQLGATVRAAFPQAIVVTSTIGKVTTKAEGNFPVDPITVTPPEAEASEKVPASTGGDIGTIIVTAPTATAAGPIKAPLPVIVVSSPVANVQAGDSVNAVANFPTITVSIENSPQAAPVDVIIALPTITVIEPDGYADDGMPGHFRLKRTLVSGRAPTSVAEREIVLNEADGDVYHRDASGDMTRTRLQAIMDALAPAGGTDGQVLAGDGSWIDPAPTYTAPVRLMPSARMTLSDGQVATATAALPVGRIVYRPFFVAQPIRIADLGLDVAVAANAVAHLGICAWSLSGTPGDVLASGEIDCSTIGAKITAVSVFLTVGWYAAMSAVSGAGVPQFVGAAAPVAIDETFTLRGDPSAQYVGSLDPAPAPDDREDTAFALITAGVV